MLITKTRKEVVDSILSALAQEIGGDVLFREIYYELFWNGPKKDIETERVFETFQWFKANFIHAAHAKDLLIAWNICNPDSEIRPTGYSDDQMTLHFARKDGLE